MNGYFTRLAARSLGSAPLTRAAPRGLYEPDGASAEFEERTLERTATPSAPRAASPERAPRVERTAPDAPSPSAAPRAGAARHEPPPLMQIRRWREPDGAPLAVRHAAAAPAEPHAAAPPADPPTAARGKAPPAPAPEAPARATVRRETGADVPPPVRQAVRFAATPIPPVPPRDPATTAEPAPRKPSDPVAAAPQPAPSRVANALATPALAARVPAPPPLPRPAPAPRRAPPPRSEPPVVVRIERIDVHAATPPAAPAPAPRRAGPPPLPQPGPSLAEFLAGGDGRR